MFIKMTHKKIVPKSEMNNTGLRPRLSPNALHHPTVMKVTTNEANIATAKRVSCVHKGSSHGIHISIRTIISGILTQILLSRQGGADEPSNISNWNGRTLCNSREPGGVRL